MICKSLYKKICAFCVVFFLLSSLFCQQEINLGTELLEPQKVKLQNDGTCAVEVITNVSGAEVYINGVFQGKTSLIVTDFVPGTYFLELCKAGYESKKYEIEVQNGCFQSYYVELKQIFGSLCLKGLDDKDSVEIYVDGVKKSIAFDGLISVNPGKHVLLVRSFGCKDFTYEFEIAGFENMEVAVQLESADFEILDFGVSSKKFNPEYKNKLGTVTFGFAVTASEPVFFRILDENENIVFEKSWEGFNYWSQSVLWNGRNVEGELLPDGNYKAEVESEHFIFYENVEIDRNFCFPIFTVTKSGLGIGQVPFIFEALENSDIGKKLFCVETAFTPVFDLSSGFFGLETGVGFYANFLKHFEIGIGASLYPVVQEKCDSIYASFKSGGAISFAGTGSLTLGGLIRYGYSSNAIFAPLAIDNGNGLGFGALIGWDSKKLKIGFDSEFIMAATTGLFINRDGAEKYLVLSDSIWKNALAVSFLPANEVSVNLWGALNNLAGVQAGTGVTFMPAESLLIDCGLKSAVVFSGPVYLSFEILLSYVF